MKLKLKLKEQVGPLTHIKDSVPIDVRDEDDRFVINNILDFETNKQWLTPYIAWGRVARVLSRFAIFLPQTPYMSCDYGVQTSEIHQYGHKFGMEDTGDFKKVGELERDPTHPHHSGGGEELVSKSNFESDDLKSGEPLYFYFEYELNDLGTYTVFASICNKEELDELQKEIGIDDDNDLTEQTLPTTSNEIRNQGIEKLKNEFREKQIMQKQQQLDRQHGLEKLKNSFKERQQQQQQRMDATIDRLKMKSIIQKDEEPDANDRFPDGSQRV